MIICVYLNPTIDKTVYIQKFVPGGTNRPDKVVINGGGKAVNAAVVLRELGQDVKVMGVLHRSDGAIIKNKLEAKSVFYDFQEIGGESRTNTKIFDGATQTVTEINESGPVIPKEILNRVAQEICDTAKSRDTVILTGSLPPECPKDFYAGMIRQLNQKGVKCVLDADGEALRLGVAERPYFIKPNIDEISAVTGKRPEGIGAVKRACMEMIDAYGISLIAVSMGGDGAVICNGKDAYYAHPVKVDVLSTVGAGDSMVAGIVARFGRPLDEELTSGVAAATASITLEGTNLCTRELFDEYYPQVKTEKI